jgi:rhodanese-related sulfurtransferase
MLPPVSATPTHLPPPLPMAPSRVRSRLRRLASRVLGSPTPEPQPAQPRPQADPPTDLEGLPPLQPGRGETPGPNHKQDISQEWASAQLHSGVPPFFIDLRSQAEHAAGHIPGAVSIPSQVVRSAPEGLPDKGERLAVYDADGHQDSAEVAEWLRQQGWEGARRLQGGFDAWQAGGDVVEQEPGDQA